ncbi:CAF17-like 4Fe-4S cluster assembly/insertion protein YgfZ [Alteraurantiacibacter palmitatis]|uniref:YgfZ/GcvT domain-containing protein n=1 Tax=Alteraurantiacibacter palmitatis TaxID=2054628 RepID=A0ABV7EAA2_9SPHN
MTGTRLFSRAVLRISPLDESEDARSFLQRLVTNDVTGTLPVYAALLSAQGKHMFDFLIWADPSASSGRAGDLLLDCEAALADDLAKRLSLYRLRRKLGIARDDSLGVFWSAAGDEGTPDPRLPALGQRWIAPVSTDDASADAAWLAHRLSRGVPEGRSEMGDLLWLETNAADLGGVSFTKGCYIGQENTARMNWRQKVGRRLLVVPLEQSDLARQVAAYPELGLAVDHRRVADIPPDLAPAWMNLHAAKE